MKKKHISAVLVTVMASILLCSCGSCGKKAEEEIPEEDPTESLQYKIDNESEIDENDALEIYKDTLASLSIVPSDNYVLTLEKQDERENLVEKMIYAVKGDDYSLTWLKGFNDFEFTSKGGKSYAYVMGKLSDDEVISEWSNVATPGRYSKDGCYGLISKKYDFDLKNIDTSTAQYQGQCFINTKLVDEFTVAPKPEIAESETRFTLETLEGEVFNVYKIDGDFLVYDNDGAMYFDDGTIEINKNTYREQDLEPVKLSQENTIRLFFDRKTQELHKIIDDKSGTIYTISLDDLEEIELPEEVTKEEMYIAETTDDEINDKLYALGFMD